MARALVGARLRSQRQKAGLSQEALASRAALDIKHLQKIESGRANATLNTIARIIEALGEDIASVLSLNPSEKELVSPTIGEPAEPHWQERSEIRQALLAIERRLSAMEDEELAIRLAEGLLAMINEMTKKRRGH